MNKYFTTKSKTLAYALNYIDPEFSFYKFKNGEDTVYSFTNSEKLQNKLELLNKVEFGIIVS